MNPNTPHALSIYFDGITTQEDANIDSVDYLTFKKLILIIKQEIVKKLEELPDEKNPLVAILVPTGPIAYACMVACIDLSICYVPLNISNSDSYNLNILDQANTTVVICSPGNHNNYKRHSSIRLELDGNELMCAAKRETYNKLYESTIIRSNVKYNSDTAYIIFTSGSTGTPKGVQISRNNLFEYLEWIYDCDFGNDPGGIVLQTAAISFDLSILGIFLPLIHGYTIATYVSGQVDVKTYLSKIQVSHIVAVPSFATLLNASKSLSSKFLEKDTTFVFCGEALTDNLCRTIFEALPNAKIWNLYGPTEATVSITSLRLTKTSYKYYSDGNTIAIGEPNGQNSLILAKPPEDNSHEGHMLVLKGPQVSDNGYYKLHNKNNQLFSGKSGEREYITGDLVHRDHKNNIYFARRSDRQVKVLGYRIELDEIESQALRLGALEAVAIARPRFVDLFYSCSETIEANAFEKAIIIGCPSHYRIRMTLIQPHLPRTVNGKVDYSSLNDYHR